MKREEEEINRPVIGDDDHCHHQEGSDRKSKRDERRIENPNCGPVSMKSIPHVVSLTLSLSFETRHQSHILRHNQKEVVVETQKVA